MVTLGQGMLDLAAIHRSPHELNEHGGVEPFRPQQADSIKCSTAPQSVGVSMVERAQC